MKNSLQRATSVLFMAGIMLACDSKEGLQPQAHDANVYQQINHRMMTEMDKMKDTNDPDNDFSMMMRMHHQGAIDMSNEELKSGDNQAMKAMAQQVITAQTSEISQFNQFLQNHTPVPITAGSTYNAEEMESMMKMMRAQDVRILTGDSDVDYAQLLIDHHQSALEMAMSELKHGDDAQIRQMATKIIEDQKKEIGMLQDWLKTNKNY
ncbi:DUF305 domain-containing protein [Fibrisoma montanum]|uniref:DUF305 domain-containing protein n=1 Tax=Fibrisoma montanum TaxID=2305895 RepID=A0A418LW08_9BACT|nr:DUF305 domain-containing protein [Fibrisoma montanum]RIV17431.1 DUF305 domain-containing protein [Fibrisoma montanum]